ncbi:MAG: phosphohydrolase [Anaerolineae bacterium]|uniref:HD domain-containing protein n=1 Tax=Promineifilum sp. TaxID=2664178 RepID=UPI001DCA9398|nr:hypothetical protein [Anaerolineales bacterium]MCB8935958.1 phosphohydrolase [Promineifilum sp.]MCO5180102.1 hypothetical protein [Promineifilum sp.]MCW5847460.1 phosphohydrolase [Anaerolineae bacterium]
MAPDFEEVSRHIYIKFAEKLSPNLTYHSLFHTRNDVLPAVRRLARANGLGVEDCMLLETAALFHDTGFMQTYSNHETYSIEITRLTLPHYGYSAGQIAAICELIAATRMPQQPHGLLQEIICDSDLDLLGRDDYMYLNGQLWREVVHYAGQPIPEKKWRADQLEFLKRHRFFTATARASRDSGKLKNVALMTAALVSANGSSPGLHP